MIKIESKLLLNFWLINHRIISTTNHLSEQTSVFLYNVSVRAPFSFIFLICGLSPTAPLINMPNQCHLLEVLLGTQLVIGNVIHALMHWKGFGHQDSICYPDTEYRYWFANFHPNMWVQLPSTSISLVTKYLKRCGKCEQGTEVSHI